jgi:predicted metalloprotease with PDZ domain
MRQWLSSALVTALLVFNTSVFAQAELNPPKDTPYLGVMTLTVDATDLDRRIMSVRETIPVRGGETVTLYYPQWLPGKHGPDGRIDKLAGLLIRAGGTRLDWIRDPTDVFAFRVNVPAGATTLDLEFQFMSPLTKDQGRVHMSADMLDLSWETVVLYPAGYYASQIPVAATVRLPEGWQFATGLETESTAGSTVTFKQTTLETLVDSPVLAGSHFVKEELAARPVPVRLNIAADRAEQLKSKPEQIEPHRRLVQQALALFGGHHFAHYDFLLALTGDLSPIGLEHHQSSENIVGTTYFTEWDKQADGRDLLAHELVHSWNGKFRRPADLWTPNFNTPMQDSLLWVYEGQTQYWGIVLAARSGLITTQQARDMFAGIGAAMEYRSGRTWRNLQDTTNDPIIARRSPVSSRSWQRGEDYYSEGALIWLEADTLIRDVSHGKRSLDDFARLFFGVESGRVAPLTYTFDDVVAALNTVLPYDWKTFLRTRLDSHGPGAPLEGFARGGYRLVYKETQNDLAKAGQTKRKGGDYTYSLGFSINNDGKIGDVQRDSPGDKAGLTNGAQILAINNMAYDSDRLNDAIADAKTSGKYIAFIVKNDERFSTITLNYRDGLRYPHLEREPSAPDHLGNILKAK